MGTIVTVMRTALIASKAPSCFWAYAASHASDILNRTTGLPDSAMTSHEVLAGSKPAIMSILPFLSFIHISEPTRLRRISFAVVRL